MGTSSFHYWHNRERENRSVLLTLKTPAAVLLGIICHSGANTERAAKFFIEQAPTDFHAVKDYLLRTIDCFTAELNFDTCELAVNPERIGSDLDFGRPSPARLLIWEFFGIIASDQCLYEALREHPKAQTVFHSSFLRSRNP